MGRQSKDKFDRILANEDAKQSFQNKMSQPQKPVFVSKREFPRIKGKNEQQKKLINAMFSGGDIITDGAAGCGKTFVSTVCAIDMVLNPKYEFDRIILVRPNLPLGPSVGMLKGDILEKFMPWMAPFIDGLEYRLNRQQIKSLLEQGVLEVQLVEHLRGRTFPSNSIVLGDEIQNMGVDAMKCLVQRKGEGAKTVLMGDLDQSDLGHNQRSGLDWVYEVDDLAVERNIRRPYHYIPLEGNVRSAESAWWGAMSDMIDEINDEDTPEPEPINMDSTRLKLLKEKDKE